MAFTYNGGSMIRGAGLQNQQQQTLFDQLARGIQNYQFGQQMDMKRKELAADASKFDFDQIADVAMVKAASGQPLNEQEQATLKAWQAKQRPVYDPTTNAMLGAPDIFSALMPQQEGRVSYEGTQEAPSGFNFDQLSLPKGIENNPKAKQVLIEETIKQQVKEGGDEKKKSAGRDDFENVLTDMLSSYEKLHEGGGIPIPMSEGKNALEKTMIAASNPIRMAANVEIPFTNANPGQFLATDNQSQRNIIKSKRPLLMSAIKQATGMTGQELNSNAELQFYLKSLSDAGNDINSTREIVRGLSERFGTGGLAKKLNAGKKQPAKQENKKSALEGLTKEQRRELYLKYKGNR